MLNIDEYKMVDNEISDAAAGVIEALIKARRVLRTYPSNHPIYKSNLDAAFSRIKAFFRFGDKLTFSFSRNEIFYDSISLYNNSQKQENLALLFYKDGIREISFSSTVSPDEVEDFLEIIASDFDKEVIEDDTVTLLWQRNFKSIEYRAEDIFFSDEEGDPEMLPAVQETGSRSRPDDPGNGGGSHGSDDSAGSENSEGLEMLEVESSDGPVAPDDAFDRPYNGDGNPSSLLMVTVTAEDREMLAEMFTAGETYKLSKFFILLFEIYDDSERPVEYEDIVTFFMKAIEYSMNNNDLRLVSETLSRLKEIIGNKDTDPLMRKSAIKILLFVSGKKAINLMGDLLCREEDFKIEDLQDFISLLDHNAIAPLVDLLFRLEDINANKKIIDALYRLVLKHSSRNRTNEQYVSMLVKGLQHPHWYIINRTIYILGQVGDKSAVNHIKKMVCHEDARVRREAVNVLGMLGKDNVLGTLESCLDDEDSRTRKASLEAIGQIATSSAKKIILGHLTEPSFKKKPYNEKKEYFRIIARWRDKVSYDFCISTITRKTFWRKANNLETKASAAYCLGLMGNKGALPVLNKCRISHDTILAEAADEAIQRIENGT